MSFQESFKQILDKKMAEHSSSSTTSSDSFATPMEPAHLAYLMGQMPRWTSGALNKSYPRPQVRPVRKPHNFSEAQEQAFQFLQSWVHSLGNNFSATELKRAFRQAALVLHPDKGGNAQDFWALKTHYETLKALLPQK